MGASVTPEPSPTGVAEAEVEMAALANTIDVNITFPTEVLLECSADREPEARCAMRIMNPVALQSFPLASGIGQHCHVLGPPIIRQIC